MATPRRSSRSGHTPKRHAPEAQAPQRQAPQTQSPKPPAPRAQAPLSRRDFLHASAGLGLAGGLGGLAALGRTFAAEVSLGPDLVRFGANIEPIVRLIEDTPRERAIEALAAQLRAGVGYRQFMAALYLAGLRNVDSRNSGFGFHCVYVINSAHLLAEDSPSDERFLPFFWALDQFKAAQIAQPRVMAPLTRPTPSGTQAVAALRAAVFAWDSDAAELALAGMARTCGATESFDELWRLGARDFRPIGHKAIFVANAWRTLHTIGWQHAEPAFRALGRSLAGYGPHARNNGIAFDDQCQRANEELVRDKAAALPGNWADDVSAAAQPDSAITAALLEPIRRGNSDRACGDALALLTQGKVRAGAVWDALHLVAAEFMLRRRGIMSVHAVTSINALRFAFRIARSAETRLFLLLQAVGWMCHFAQSLALTEIWDGPRILELPTGDAPADPAAAVEQIVAQLGVDGPAAAISAIAYANRHPEDRALATAARRLVFTRATDAHDYKYFAAALEDMPIVAPAWRPLLVGASILHLPTPAAPESRVISAARDALRGV